MNKSEIKLGDEFQCNVSGFKGIAEERTDFLNGCCQLLLRPKQSTSQKKANEFPKGIYLDVQQLKRVGDGINKKSPVKKTASGGPVRNENRGRL